MEFVLILRSDDKICVTEIARAASHARLVEVDSDSSVRQHDELVSDLSDFLRRTKSVVFVNPAAGARRTERSLRDVRGAFARMEMAPEFVTTASVAELEVRVRAAVADDARLLFAMGGDGTVQALVNAVGARSIGGADVVIGVLPSGGGNDFASALEMPKRVVEVVLSLRAASIRDVDVLRARTADGISRLFVGGGGLGLDVEAARYASGAYRQWPGRSRYFAAALRAWREFEPFDVRVEFPEDDIAAIDARVIGERVMIAAVLNTPTYGAGLRVAPDARVDDGLLDVSILKSLSAAQVVRAIPRMFASGSLPKEYFVRKTARAVVLQADRACMFHGDGEIIGPAPVRVEVVPKAIRVIVPESADEANGAKLMA